jgi:hypothetical protein
MQYIHTYLYAHIICDTLKNICSNYCTMFIYRTHTHSDGGRYRPRALHLLLDGFRKGSKPHFSHFVKKITSFNVSIDGYVDQESSSKSLGGVCAGHQPRHQGVRPSPAADVRGREIQADVHTRIRMLVKICNLILYVAMCSIYFFHVYLSDGANGLPPLIPPNSSIYFDLTLLGFRPRCVWVGLNNIYALSTILI